MQLTFWGVRGSVPSPERSGWRYGGNTPCLEVRAGNPQWGEQILILDAGTGIRDLGHTLLKARGSAGLELYLFFSHYHWDHVQGLPFFEPLYQPGNTLHLFGPRPALGVPSTPEGVLNFVFRPPFFPVTLDQLRSTYHIKELESGSELLLGATRIRTCRLNHPQGSLAYRIEDAGLSVVYATDHEPGKPEFDQALTAFAQEADVLIADAQYRPEELAREKAGWGHSSWRNSVELAREAQVKSLILFHHEPYRADEELDEFLRQSRQRFPATWAAAEGMVLEVSSAGVRIASQGTRLGQRVRVSLPVEVEVRRGNGLERAQARLEDLSFHGAFLVSEHPLKMNETMDVLIPLGDGANGDGGGRQELRLRGFVLRSDPRAHDPSAPLGTGGGGYGTAVYFPGQGVAQSSTVPEKPKSKETA
jgi:phosphoribosyl 1,2-cyclic phosphodiesterase